MNDKQINKEHQLRVEILTIEKRFIQARLEAELQLLDMRAENDLIYKESEKAKKEREYTHFISNMIIQKEEFLKDKDPEYFDSSEFVKFLDKKVEESKKVIGNKEK